MGEDRSIFQALEQLYRSEDYPFHMPGHKRRMEGHPLAEAYGMDITEIDGFDNLHDPQGMILDSMNMAKQMYGSKKTWFLVNGSTAGILTAIHACVKPGGKLLMARNCHKAVYHAVSLLGLQTRYVYPKVIENIHIAGGIAPEDVAAALAEDKDIEAVIITSPTYDGIVSPIQEIAGIVHRAGVVLIVDEAHGAHFPFSPQFPTSALRQGADLVIHSLHKTLPAFTQTALLHLAGDLVEETKVERYLSVFQTSSPSYLLTGSIDYCLRLIRCQGADLWTDILRSTGEFTRKMKELNCLHLVDSTDTACWNKDPLKLLMVVKDGTVNRKTGTEFTGHDLYHRLREEYHLQMEMEADTYVLGILTCMDTQEGLSRLARSLREIDADCEGKTDRTSVNMSADKGIANLAGENRGSKSEDRLQVIDSIAVAMEKHKLLVDLEDAAGRECGCFLNLYPPGIPLIVPGEVISRDLVDKLIRYKRQGLTLQGLMAEKVTVVTD